MTLPPGQRALDRFPRFGTHLHHPPPAVPDEPVIKVGGAGVEPFTFAAADLASLSRREMTADFHCVAGWSAVGLRWEGVPFATFLDVVVRARAEPATAWTHVAFRGLDGYEAVLLMEDALAEDVLIADRLDGRPLDSDHGAPVRLVSPRQYGYVNTKHLSRIELHTAEPHRDPRAAPLMVRLGLHIPLFTRHPRARVWEEERNGVLPSRIVRPVNRLLIPPIMWLCARGSRRSPEPPGPGS